MKIVVLNGSPKGELSVTLQYVLYLQKKLPGCEWIVHHVAQKLHSLENDGAAFRAVLDDVAAADACVWAFPLYYMLVHGNYKRFIELIHQHGAQDAFRGKYTAVLTTSIHFFDHTAVGYMHGICDDLEIEYLGAFSAAMYDLQQPERRGQLEAFGRDFLDAVETGRPAFRDHPPIVCDPFDYRPNQLMAHVDPEEKRVVVLTDSSAGSPNLARMVEQFGKMFTRPIEVFDIAEVDIKSGCLGCLQCGYDNTCVWEGKDEFVDFYRSRVLPADVLVLAGAVSDRYLSSRWKTFFDRTFFKNHVPALAGKQIGFLIAGPLGQLAELRQILESSVSLEGANLVGIVTDEPADRNEIDARLAELARALIRRYGQSFSLPPMFPTVAGAKLFRDEIWASMRFPFVADYKYYKAHGLFDFPRRSWRVRLTDALMLLAVKIPGFRNKVYKEMMKEKMVEPLQKIVEGA